MFFQFRPKHAYGTMASQPASHVWGLPLVSFISQNGSRNLFILVEMQPKALFSILKFQKMYVFENRTSAPSWHVERANFGSVVFILLFKKKCWHSKSENRVKYVMRLFSSKYKKKKKRQRLGHVHDMHSQPIEL